MRARSASINIVLFLAAGIVSDAASNHTLRRLLRKDSAMRSSLVMQYQSADLGAMRKKPERAKHPKPVELPDVTPCDVNCMTCKVPEKTWNGNKYSCICLTLAEWELHTSPKVTEPDPFCTKYACRMANKDCELDCFCDANYRWVESILDFETYTTPPPEDTPKPLPSWGVAEEDKNEVGDLEAMPREPETPPVDPTAD
mmetsp:Transcript_73476/g.204125  ORF Transcript_73476/g.204125 Transcript_73476/m.204125 type:complete len:199 (-) Transcript_73476:258-854(-)